MLQLAYPIDDTVDIDGVTYEMDMSFDNILRLIDLLNDKEIDDVTQINIGLQMLLGVNLDYDIQKKEKIFYEIFKNTIGKDSERSQQVDLAGNPMPSNDHEKTYCLKQDADYIYASFMSDYGIDLIDQQGQLHWDKFKALLGGLTDGSKFLRVIEIRTMELPTGKGSQKQRTQIKKLKEQYALKEDE